jgi:outer membrane protein TolC
VPERMADRRCYRPIATVMGMLLTGWLIGCHAAPTPVTPPPLADCVENRVSPQPIQPDVSPLARSHVDPAVVPASAVEESLSQLFEVDAQCQAARVAPLADLLQLETQLAAALASCVHGDAACALNLQVALLRLQMVEHRNTAAADALRAFYNLADVEGRSAKLDQSIRILDQAIDRAERLHERGLLQDIDRSALRRQRLELVSSRKELQLARVQLNAALRTLLGCDATLSPNYWPEISWAVKPLPVDETSALAVALAQRPDIRSLNLVLGELSVGTLPVARAVLSAADPALGTAEARHDWLGELHCPDGSCDEVAIRQSQLLRLLQSTQLTTAAEVRSAVARIEAATQDVLLAEKTVRSWQDRLSEVRRTRDIADGSIFDVTQLEGELLAAEAELIERITALRLARLELREAQGILPAECGLDTLCSGGELVVH